MQAKSVTQREVQQWVKKLLLLVPHKTIDDLEMETFPIGDYKRVAYLGKGAHGSVELWKKKGPLLRLFRNQKGTATRPKYVAIKTLKHPKDDFKQAKMRQRELNVLGKVQKDSVENLVRYYGSAEEEDLNCKVLHLVMQACHGDLTKLIKCKRVLELHELREICKQMLTGLVYLHGSKDIASAETERIIHR